MNHISSFQPVQFGLFGRKAEEKTVSPKSKEELTEIAEKLKKRLAIATKRTPYAYFVEVRETKDGSHEIYAVCNDQGIHSQVKDFEDVSIWQPTNMPHAAKAKAENLVDSFKTFPVRDSNSDSIVTFDVREEGPEDKEYAVITVNPRTTNWSRIESVLSYGGVYNVRKPDSFYPHGQKNLLPFQLIVDRNGKVSQRVENKNAELNADGEPQTIDIPIDSTYR